VGRYLLDAVFRPQKVGTEDLARSSQVLPGRFLGRRERDCNVPDRSRANTTFARYRSVLDTVIVVAIEGLPTSHRSERRSWRCGDRPVDDTT
jgi:hypothetical protein